MDTDKLQALYFGPLEALAAMMESSEATGEECGELLRLCLAGIMARLERDGMDEKLAETAA